MFGRSSEQKNNNDLAPIVDDASTITDIDQTESGAVYRIVGGHSLRDTRSHHVLPSNEEQKGSPESFLHDKSSSAESSESNKKPAMLVDQVFSADGCKVPVRIYRASHLASARNRGEKREIVENKPVLYFHGLFDHSGWALPIAQQLGKTGFSIYAFDRRGSGLSELRRGYCRSYADIIEDALATAEFAMYQGNNWGVHVVGNSFGCLPAVLFASEYPELCYSLTMANPAVFSDWYPSSSGRRFGDFLTTRRPRALRLEPELFSDKEDLQLLIQNDLLANHSLHPSVRQEAYKMQRLLHRKAADLSLPVCMMLPGEDAVSNESQHRAFFETIASGYTALLHYSDSRHMIEYSNESKSFLEDFSLWLEEIEYSIRVAKAFSLEEILPLADSLDSEL